MAAKSSVLVASPIRQSYIEISRYFRNQHRLISGHAATRAWRQADSHTRQGSQATAVHVQVPKLPRRRYHSVLSKISTPKRSPRLFTTIGTTRSASSTSGEPSAASNEHLPILDWRLLDNYVVNSDTSGEPLIFHGYLTSHRVGRKVDFLTVVDPYLQRAIQVVCPKSSSPQPQSSAESEKTVLVPHTPLKITGRISKTQKLPAGLAPGSTTFKTTDHHVGNVLRIGHIEIQAENVVPLNRFPEQLVAKHETNFPPEMRHLSFRTNHALRQAIRLRSQIKHRCAEFLLQHQFDDVETPMLFKSTPEGAREFIVPTRRKGLAYALPQSPQQYKQILMASGIPRYFQFARCFRDEDMRADRQPEFTQLDLEMSFAGSRDVMSVIEQLILRVVWPAASRTEQIAQDVREALGNTTRDSSSGLILPSMSYHDAMSKYGSDKPDPRLGANIMRVDDWVPDSLKKMLTDISNPIVEMLKIRMKDQDPTRTRDFMRSFMDLPSSAAYLKNSQGMAGISIYDPTKPLCGLATFGHEAAAEIEEHFEPEEGDLLVALCRENKPFVGGSTILGNLRRDLLEHAVSQGLVDKPVHDSMFWMIDFPLFSPIEEGTPGQEGGAGLCSTHHPFTAPRVDQDLALLQSDPSAVVGDHYDLVINGIEVGGGSRRIHDARMQEMIFQDVLKMRPERIEDFRHLLNALAAGCPPHAGFALGFDRLMTILLDRSSVRDVIAFPKTGDGEDKLVGSPSSLTTTQLSTYRLQISDAVESEAEPTISKRA